MSQELETYLDKLLDSGLINFVQYHIYLERGTDTEINIVYSRYERLRTPEIKEDWGLIPIKN